MKAVRQRDTRPEVSIRKLLHAQGLRYRVDYAPLKGLRRRADLVFTKAKIAVYIDGCFWHGCPHHVTWPKENAEFWRAKIEGNRLRDADTDRLLKQSGWTVIRVWEHERPEDAANQIKGAVSNRPGSPPGE